MLFSTSLSVLLPSLSFYLSFFTFYCCWYRRLFWGYHCWAWCCSCCCRHLYYRWCFSWLVSCHFCRYFAAVGFFTTVASVMAVTVYIVIDNIIFVVTVVDAVLLCPASRSTVVSVFFNGPNYTNWPLAGLVELFPRHLACSFGLESFQMSHIAASSFAHVRESPFGVVWLYVIMPIYLRITHL